MPAKTTWLGIILIILGVAGYVASGAVSITALIPSFFGLVFLGLGLAARRENLRKHLMHASAALALLGFIGTVSGVVKLVSILGGADGRFAAALAQSIMAVLTLAYVAAAVQSFVAARKARALGTEQA
jgi:hypothetical protein